MKQLIAKLARSAVILGVAALAMPAPSPAATAQIRTTLTKSYDTTFVKDAGQAYPLTGGRLKLTLTPEGYINGFYTPPDSASFIPVVGGRNGSDVWFDIGTNVRSIHVTGTLKGAQILGYATDASGVRYRFTANPVLPG